jgi:hypothetical protein
MIKRSAEGYRPCFIFRIHHDHAKMAEVLHSPFALLGSEMSLWAMDNFHHFFIDPFFQKSLLKNSI